MRKSEVFVRALGGEIMPHLSDNMQHENYVKKG